MALMISNNPLEPNDRGKIPVEIVKGLSDFRIQSSSGMTIEQLSKLSELFYEFGEMAVIFNVRGTLSVMETLIIALIVLGLDCHAIAEIFSISPSTVFSHFARIKGKFQVTRKLDAVVAALRKGIIKLIH